MQPSDRIANRIYLKGVGRWLLNYARNAAPRRLASMSLPGPYNEPYKDQED